MRGKFASFSRIKVIFNTPFYASCKEFRNISQGHSFTNTSVQKCSPVYRRNAEVRSAVGSPLSVYTPSARLKPINTAIFCSNRGISTTAARYSESPDEESKNNLLMDFPQATWPSFIKAIKNWILAKLIIRPYMDNDFTLESFVHGGKQALVHVSHLISEGKFEELEGLVSAEAIAEVQKKHSKLSLAQRQNVAIESDDIYFAFPYQVGIIIEDVESVQKRFVEITMCYHCFLGLGKFRQIDPNFQQLTEHKDKIIMCNYRFIREYTKGVQSEWMINVISHFKPTVIY